MGHDQAIFHHQAHTHRYKNAFSKTVLDTYIYGLVWWFYTTRHTYAVQFGGSRHLYRRRRTCGRTSFFPLCGHVIFMVVRGGDLCLSVCEEDRGCFPEEPGSNYRVIIHIDSDQEDGCWRSLVTHVSFHRGQNKLQHKASSINIKVSTQPSDLSWS